uniref:PsbP C-terminal domain-containing protein n=1 Tax=Opuntia streptacantha TaxID=393608 RepID=A0A7C8ZJR6_OPUST
MALSSVSTTWVPATLSNKMNAMPQMMIMSTCSPNSINSAPSYNRLLSCSNSNSCSSEERFYERRSLLMAAGIFALSFIPSTSASAQVPGNYTAFVDKEDGYSYVYPSDWREFDFRAHDSAFKDRYLQLQNVRLSFIPTDKKDIHDLGPMEDVVRNLVNNIYAAPNQLAFIKDMQERSTDGKNYYTFEYQLTSPNFSVTRFTTVAIANGKPCKPTEL